jgi:hypothetical protein
MKTTTTPQIFLTDYASYNNGTQFEFGHWVDLTDFSDADELREYIKNHFAECDKTSPLYSPREEYMYTDFEGFPEQLYSECGMDFDKLFEYLELDEDDKIKVAFILDQGEKIDYALDHFENVELNEDYTNLKYDLFEMYYPNAETAERSCPYLHIDYDQFLKENYTEFEYEGTTYFVNDNWNN